MERRAVFKSRWLPYALIAPQVLLVFTFFYWPTGAALVWAFTLEQPWGGGSTFVGFENFAAVFGDPLYWASVGRSVFFAAAATTLAMGVALLLALFTDRQLSGYRAYRFVTIWPYAVAAPAAGLAFRFIFASEAGILAFLNQISPSIIPSFFLV